MEPLRSLMDKMGRHFRPGGKLEKLYPLFEATDAFLFTPGTRTARAPFVRDAVDLKRVMALVVVALVPATLFGVFNIGYQAQTALGLAHHWLDAATRGLQIFLPILLVSYLVGGFWEVLFACVRKHEVNEGLLVTGILYALTLPPTIPLWQAALGISFGVVFAKEIFGGTGFNFVNPALAGRAFLFFSYPGQMSGDAAWVAVDGVAHATPLAVMRTAAAGASATDHLAAAGYNWSNMFLGLIPGSIGETSKLACLLGLVFLLIVGVASWRIIVGCFAGMAFMSALIMCWAGPSAPAYFTLPPHWHMVMGGFAFGAIFMATDPVSAAATNLGRWIYGLMIGALVVVVRVFNPAYAEATMLVILLMNVLAPLIDYCVVEAHVAWRTKRLAAVKAGQRRDGAT